MKNNVRRFREQKRLTQTELGYIVGTTRMTISAIERSINNPNVLLALKIAKYFGVSLEELFILEEGGNYDKKIINGNINNIN